MSTEKPPHIRSSGTVNLFTIATHAFESAFLFDEDVKNPNSYFNLIFRDVHLPAGIHALHCLSYINKHLPESIKKRLYGKVFQDVPLCIPDETDSPAMPRIGIGGVNIVYRYKNQEDGMDYAVGIKRFDFDTAEEAEEYASIKQQQYQYFTSIFRSIPKLIPKEINVVYKDHKKRSNVMFIREFVDGNLKDFFSYDKDALIQLLRHDSTLFTELHAFINVANQHRDVIVNEQLDLAGANNLVISTTETSNHLVLLEGDLRDRNRCTKYSQLISDRLDYITSLIEQARG